MADLVISHNTLVLVADGRKALFLRNKGDGRHVDFAVEQIVEQSNPATRDQGTDKPGRSFPQANATQRSAMEETDWHELAEARFAGEIAETLYEQAHSNRFEKLIVVAPPKVLGGLRKAFHKEVLDRITAEVAKELTSQPVSEIGRTLSRD